MAAIWCEVCGRYRKMLPPWALHKEKTWKCSKCGTEYEEVLEK